MTSNDKTTETITNNTFQSFLKHVQWQQFAAGVSGGVISTLLLHPFDLLKIRFQGKFNHHIAFI